MTDHPAPGHRTPEDLDDATVVALGKVSEALEAVERARGHLYSFHQLSGSADRTLRDGVALLRKAGHVELAEEIDAELVGRNVLPGMWTFQAVEAYDDDYWTVFRRYEHTSREMLAGGRRHLHEAGMKERERSRGVPGTGRRHPVRPLDP